MNTLTVETAEVNPTGPDAALDDAAYDAWIEANADAMADESEAAHRAENGWLF